MYHPISRGEFLESFLHICDLHISNKGTSDEEKHNQVQAQVLADAIRRQTGETVAHPLLRTMYKVADVLHLDDEGVHRLYGYRLERFFMEDIRYNGDRTHFVDPYLLPEDQTARMIPQRLKTPEVMEATALLDDVVAEWNDKATVRGTRAWRSSRLHYLYIGREDALSLRFAAGSIAAVQLVDEVERRVPRPDVVYVIQFGNGYRCSRCTVSGKRLILLVDDVGYTGPREFVNGKEARILARVKTLYLPVPVASPYGIHDLPAQSDEAPLIPIWDHLNAESLFTAKSQRFASSLRDRKELRERMEDTFHDHFSETTRNRFRRPSAWMPHAHVAIYLTIHYRARHCDTLRCFGVQRGVQDRYSLDELLHARRLSDLGESRTPLRKPEPSPSWEMLNGSHREYPGLVIPQVFSDTFERAQFWRLGESRGLRGIPRALPKGSWVMSSHKANGENGLHERIVGVVVQMDDAYTHRH